MKSPVKWVGSKKWLPYHIDVAKVLGSKSTYFEPFIGGGSIFFHFEPKKSMIGDSNPDLVIFYRMLKDRFPELIDRLETYENNSKNKAAYYKIRAFNPDETRMEDPDRAARFFYILKLCFNGVWRVNSKGECNSPWGYRPHVNVCPKEELLQAHRVLNKTKVKIQNMDYIEMAEYASEGDVIYFDPPYLPVSDTADFTGYTNEKFYHEDHENLLELCSELVDSGVYVILTLGQCDLIKKYKKFMTVTRVTAKRMVSCSVKSRKGINEFIISNDKSILR